MRHLLLILLMVGSVSAQTFTRSLAFMGNANPRSAAAAANIPGIFVDSVAGSDSNAGTSNSPFATSLKVNRVIGFSATTNIFFKRGGKYFRFQIPTNSTVDAYGTANYAPDIYGGITNSKPVFSGALHITNSTITKTGGRTIVYQATLSPQIYFDAFPFTNIYGNTISSNVLMLWQNNVRVGARWEANAGAGGVASVDAGAGRFYYDTATKIIYFSTLDGSDPTATGFFEASFDTLAVHGGDNVTVKNIIAEKNYAYDSDGSQGYGILAFGSGTYNKCVARLGWNHNAGVANNYPAGLLVFMNCKAGDMEVAGGSSYIAYKDSGFSSVIFTNCYAYGYDTTKGNGFYTHDNDGDVNVAAQVVNCVAYYMDAGFVDSYPRSTNWYGNTSVYTGQGYVTAGAGAHVKNFTNYYPAFASCFGVGVNQGTAIIYDSKFAFTNESFNGFAIRSGNDGAATINMTNCIIAKNGSASSSALYAVGSTTWNIWSNKLENMSYGYRGSGAAGSGDYNNYHSISVQADYIDGTYNTLSAWKTHVAPIDANATSADLTPSSGFFDFTIVDPTGGDGN